MKWAYSIQQKIKTAVLLAVVLVLVMFNNIYQNKQFEKVVNSFSSLYEDRLVAETYIYKIAESLHQVRHIVENPKLSANPNEKVREMILQCDLNITKLIHQYMETKFTENEQKYFDHLSLGIDNLGQVEKAYFGANSENHLLLRDSIQTLVENNLFYLSELSKIQIEEGKKMNLASKKALMSNIASSQLETSFLIIIAIIIQILIFASKSMGSILKQKPGLN